MPAAWVNSFFWREWREKLTSRLSWKRLLRPAAAGLGRSGERFAARYLRRNFYSILDSNWRCPRGEIDIVARRGRLLVFVEVKTRKAQVEEYFPALAAVDAEKQQRLRRLAAWYMASNRRALRRFKIRAVRFDAIAVIIKTRPVLTRTHLVHQRDAFAG